MQKIETKEKNWQENLQNIIGTSKNFRHLESYNNLDFWPNFPLGNIQHFGFLNSPILKQIFPAFYWPPNLTYVNHHNILMNLVFRRIYKKKSCTFPKAFGQKSKLLYDSYYRLPDEKNRKTRKLKLQKKCGIGIEPNLTKYKLTKKRKFATVC